MVETREKRRRIPALAQPHAMHRPGLLYVNICMSECRSRLVLIVRISLSVCRHTRTA